MPLTRLDNLISSKTGKYLYVSPDDFNATDSLSNRGNSPVTPFKSIQRAFLEIARYSYTPGPSNDRFDQFSIMLMPGIHYIDNRPGLVDTAGIDEFSFNQILNSWGDDPILDVGNPDNVLWKFNNTEGGAIIPRGSSLVGYDLRRTTVRPLYVPDPASVTVPRSAIFNVTGGCYFWQFTLKDGQTTAESPLFNPATGSGEVYYDPTDFTKKAAPNFSHHKLTVFEYADKEELQIYYRKVAKAFSQYQPTIDDVSPEGIPEFDFNIQENRIVGPLSDSRVIESLRFTDATTNPAIPASTTEIEVTTKVDHGYFAGQFVAISGTEVDDEIEGFWGIYDISDDPRKFTYRVPFVVSGIGQGLSSGIEVSVDTTPALGQNAQVLAEVDSVESASPYVFNVSIRSVWGICGIWANGLKATGFKSMVIAQYTGVSLQRDDRAFIRYDEYANTWNQASLVDAFATVPYHAKGDSYWKDDWRNFHVRASEDAFIQNVSIFAVGFADHFLMESGGDMSITNSNSNFGNTSLHAIGFKGFSFNQDKAGYITDIIPPQQVTESETNREKVLYYTIDVQGSIQDPNNTTKLYLGGTDLDNPLDRPAATIGGYRVGGKSNDKLYVKLDQKNGIDTFEASLQPTGFVKYIAKGSVLNPSDFTGSNLDYGGGITGDLNVSVDAANLIASNRRMIQEEVFGYILEKYPRLQNISYVNPGLDPAAGRYFDSRNLILNNRQEIVDTAYAQMLETFPNYDGNNGNTFGDKCKRDIGFVVDAIAEDLRDGGNANIIAATREYFDGNGDLIDNGLVGEEQPAVFAFNRARDLCKKAIANLLQVKATIYDPEDPSILTPYGVVAGSTGSAALGLNSEGVTVDDANKQDPAGRYKDARNRIVANREFILDAALAEVGVYHPDFYIPGDSQTNSDSRFADAYRLIRRNSKEISDRALASIAVEYPDFYFPGDAQTTADSRFYDSYRLIEQNKDQIVDTALAQIAVEYPDFYFPGDAQTTSTSRFADAYRLIQENRTEIVDGSWTNMVGANPSVAGTETKCKRDLGYFVDAISLDVFMGGNKYARKFISEYFDGNGQFITNGLDGEEAASKRAFEEARDFMRQAVANQLTERDLSVTADPDTGSNLDPASCADVQSAIDTLTAIAIDVLDSNSANYRSLAGLPAETPYTSETGELKCRRDIGYFVDAVALDIFTRGNEYSHRFATEYFDANGSPISNGLVGETAESITAFNKARDMMKLAVTNGLYEKDLTITADPNTAPDNQDPTSCADVQSAIDTLTSIAVIFIQNGNLNSMPIEVNKGSAPAGMTKCSRDIGYFIDAIGVDIFTGSNKHTRTFIKQYFDGNTPISNGIHSTQLEKDASETAFETAANFMRQAVSNQLYYRDLTITADPATGNNEDPASCANVQSQITTLATYVTDSLAASYNVASDLPAETPSNFLTGETKCRRDIGHIVDAVAQDLWFGGNEYTIAATKEYFNNNALISNGVDNEVGPSITAFKRAADLMNRAVNNQYYDRDLTLTLDAVGDPAFVADIHADAYNLVLDNKEFIAKEAYERMLTAYPTYTPQSGNTEQDCLDDVYDVLEEVMYDVKFGGNARTYDAAQVYVSNTLNGEAIETFIDAERDEAARVFSEAKTIAIQCLRNETVSVSANNPLTQKKDLTIVDDWDIEANLPTCGSAAGAVDTLMDLIIQAIGTDAGVGNLTGVVRTAPTQPTTYTLGNCSDVLATIDTLIGIVCDSLLAGDLESLPPLSTGNWDCANVRTSIENLFDILTDAISSGSLADLPTVNVGDFIVNAEESKCFRDVSYIVDAIVNDLRYGGNINSIQAGEAYFVGAQLDYIDGEAVETTDAWNYVGQMAIAAMRNFDFLAFNCVTTDSTSLVSIPTPDGGTRNVPAASIIDVGDTSGILIGMRLEAYPTGSYTNGLLNAGLTYEEDHVDTNIPADAYVKSIIDSNRIEIGVNNSRLETGNNVNCGQVSSSQSIYFTYPKGQWANTLPETVVVGPAGTGEDVIQDTTTSASQRECASTAAAILQLTDNITTIINTGLTKTVNGIEVPTIDRVEPSFNTALLASRATVFTIDTTGTGSTNAHDFETGTPVRLVPRPRFDVASGKYVDVDKRLVRLPKGFETNETYYVIAPGRATQPVDYSGTTYFNGSDQTKLMLATSKENAAAGIYIYAAETESIDPDVEIDIYQFVIDDKYDLHTYACNLVNTVVGGIETDISHIFDKPSPSTTPQKVFFRAIEGSDLPDLSTSYANDPTVAITSGVNAGKINPNVEFYVRYQTSKVFTIHKSLADAQANVTPIQFNNQNGPFRVFANKKRSPMRFDPYFNGADTDNGKWYLNCVDRITGESNTDIVYREIFYRINETDYASKPTTTDTWYERVNDEREANERTYKLRYVIPKYIENARDPINGFVIKTRTDDTRRLVPQKVLLKPVAGNVYGARFENPQQPGEFIGYTQVDFDADDTLNQENAYDPFRRPLTGENQDTDYRAIARFNSGIAATIQSGRYVQDDLDPAIEYLELTVFDHAVDTKNFPGLRNEIFTTVKISAPQGGDFVPNKTQKITTNSISFTGNSSGTAYIHAYYTVEGDHFLILKGISGAKGINSLEFSEFANTRFQQGNVFADMLEDQDMGKSLPLKTHIRKNFPEYYYKQNGANVYTITPGDRIQDDAGIEYYVYSVADAGVIEDTFYIFDSQELQKRIPGQQDGVYYLTALRGNISPYPTGAGVSTNFRKFKFSQPVGKIYPLNYRNDPLWFTKNGTTEQEKNYYSQLIDPPQSYSAADNYIHGKVTVNDTKNSVTRELMFDLTNQPAFVENTYTGSNEIKAQTGNATSGSEDRRIPIAGDSGVITDQRYYVELRRPSIARAGNHTFEYLGFGPGNYSTGLPARQEIVLEPEEDFYAQSKKQDAGIVFYTGINSQGDLYIGNRRINAITGEETFIDRAVLADDGDEDDVIGQLVTTFDTPVTFNQNITIVGGPDGELVNNVNSPLLINVPDQQLTNQNAPLVIYSLVSASDPVTGLPQDATLNRDSFFPNATGDIRIGKNRVDAAIFGFNSRGSGQGYKIQTSSPGGIGSNITPNQDEIVSAGGSRLNAEQYITYGGTVLPETGDITLKGGSIGKNGSLGWIYANIYTDIPNNIIAALEVIVDQSVNIAKFTFIDTSNNEVSIGSLNIKASSEIRINNLNYNGLVNGTWKVVNTPSYPYNPAENYVYFEINPRTGSPIGAFNLTWSDILNDAENPSPSAVVSFSVSNWKEVGVLGSEAIRTETETYGDFKLGINTIARATHSAYTNAFVETQNTDPRANLDVVGNAYISGRKMTDWLAEDNYNARERNRISDAFVVGWNDEASPNSNDIDAVVAAFRISTINSAILESGRGDNENKVGINITNAELDRALVVKGDARFTEDVRFERDIEVNGNGTIAEIRTSETVGTFNLLNDPTFVGGDDSAGLNLAGYAKTIRIGDFTTDNQWIYIGDKAAADQFVRIGSAANHSNIFIGNVDADAAISRTKIGGAYNRLSSLSTVDFETKQVTFAGDVTFGLNKQLGGDRLDAEQVVTLRTEAGVVSFFSGNTQTIDFALNASEVNIAGQGGTTTIRNSLEIDGATTFNASVRLCGGVSAFSFVGARAQLGSTAFAHDDGILGPTTFNQNVDLINVFALPESDPNYNRLDTAGSDPWGGTEYQALIPGGGPENADLPALTGDQYYLPLLNAPGDYFQEGDYLILDTVVDTLEQTHPEIVRVVPGGLVGAESAPYYLIVQRQPFGTFTALKTNHPDRSNRRTPIYKVNIAFDSTWTEQPIDGAGVNENIYLATFGGTLQTGRDYIIVDREDTNDDGVFDQGEVFKLVSSLDQVNKKFQILSGCPDGDVLFEVDSVTGETIIGNDGVDGENGKLTINGSFEFKGGCKTGSKTQFTGNAQQGLTTITAIPDTSGLEVGDYVQIFTGGGTVTLEQNRFPEDSGDTRFTDPQIVSIVGNVVTLNVPFTGAGSQEGITFEASTDEKFRITDRVRDIFTIDGCSGDTVIGNPSGQIYVNRARFNTTSAAHAAGDTVYVILKDPKVDNNIATTFVDTLTPITTTATQLTVDDISDFETGDFILVGYGSGGNEEFMQVSGTPVATAGTSGYLPVNRVGSIPQFAGAANIHQDGESVWRVLVRETTVLTDDVDAGVQTSIILGLENSDLVPFFLDREYFIVVNSEVFEVTNTTTNDGGTELVKTNYHHGRLTVYDDVKFVGSNFEITGTDNNVPILKLINNEEHHFEGGALDINAETDISGTLRIFPSRCVEDPEAIQFTNKSFTPTFRVEPEFGDTFVGRLLDVAGIQSTIASQSQKILDIRNLGNGGTKSFTIRQDSSIDAFGYTGWKNKNGGHITKFVNAQATLEVNINYIVAVAPSTGALVLTLPSDAVTGDTIRITEVGGQLTYNNSLVIRAPIVGGEPVAVQGDTEGTKLGGLSTPYSSGELVVQNRNASFGLVYVGQTDGDNFIPAAYQGWWLTEL
ncbi:putative short tail fibre [Synechococcus phage S-RSM4]|uniref:Putative short tail fibre n=6 Tax=root TaxID=1 RepID=C7BVI2_9CAUD|nr:short tail fiber protein [Synechococcus phage S-RSM4]CAR63411.1 putative short tail fibre [Synechococcus phage S-RSM4]